MEIEESLLNIEQNLIYVHDLEIPQFNNLLQSTINRKCSDEWPSYVCKSKSMIFNDEQTSLSTDDSDDGNIHFIASLDNLPARQCANNSDNIPSFRDNINKPVNFNSHGSGRKSEEERRNFHRRRKNSLDMGTFKRRRKTSLEHCYFSKSSGASGEYRKASSHGALEISARENNKKKISCTSIKSNDCIFNEINERARDCRRKFDSICTARDNVDCISGKIDESTGKDKNYTRSNSLPKDNALVPGKLISLSFSLLLAALLQAVRCLADIVEDTFRSVALDKYALHD
uniref:MCM6 protein n=1 Tax=Fopius arisanus TaxID=64838 RepID=A0A0C9QWA6_9HYME